MVVVFDTTFLIRLFEKNAKPITDPKTKQPVEYCQEKIKHLAQTLNQRNTKIIIPTPVLAEYLVLAGPDASSRLREFESTKVFEIKPFDKRAAVECAVIEDGDMKRGKRIEEFESKVKVKFDRQIIAIAKTCNSNTLYTGDNGLAKCAKDNGFDVVLIYELPLPPQLRGLDMTVYNDSDV